MTKSIKVRFGKCVLAPDQLAEKVGFEPTVPDGITGFQDRLLKPLGHLSGYADESLIIIAHKIKVVNHFLENKKKFTKNTLSLIFCHCFL